MGTEESDLRRLGGDDEDGQELTFDKVWWGFAPAQVSEYLKRVASSALSLESRLSETRSELLETRRERDRFREALESSADRDPFEGVSRHLTQLVRSFDERVDGLRRDAEAQADDILAEVRAESERILTRARAESESMVAEARAEADRTREQARAEAERIRAEAQTEEEQAQSRAGRLVHQAQQEAERVQSSLAAMRESMLDEFRGIRDRTLAALGELQLVIERGSSSDKLVIVEEAEQAASTNGPP